MISITPNNCNAEVYKQIKSFANRTKKGLSKAFLQVAPAVIKEAQADMSKPKNGLTYIVFKSTKNRNLKRGRIHIASAKGEAPAILSGTLFRSMGFNRQSFHTLVIGSKAEHAQWLEPSPDESWSGYLNRPFMLKAIESQNKNTENYFVQCMQSEIMG